MGMIRIYEKPGKTKRKPGWQKVEADYQAWLKGVKTMSSGIAKPKNPLVLNKKVKPKTETVEQCEVRRAKYVVGTAGKSVPRPELLYRDNPEMLERELKARERKFNVAPAYNKGNDVYVSEEELLAQLAGNKRRP
jgi:hypothetical protein